MGLRLHVGPNAFGNALGNSLASANWSSGGDAQTGNAGAGTGYDDEAMAIVNRRGYSLTSVSGQSLVDVGNEIYSTAGPVNDGDVLAHATLKGGDLLRLSAGSQNGVDAKLSPEDEIAARNIARDAAQLQQIRDDANALNASKVQTAMGRGESLAPTVENAARLGLYDTSGNGTPVQTTYDDAVGLGWAYAGRFLRGAVHGAADMVWQPVANTVDLGQALVGLVSGGRYEPTWLSGIGQNYQAGMSYGETVTRAVLGSNPVTGVGMASYDLTGSAMKGDWGGVAEGAGGLAGGFAAGKYGQRFFAPEPGAQLGIYRARPQVEITDPNPGRLLDPLPKGEAPNFTSAEPVYLGGRTLYRVFDNVKAYDNGAYWGEKTYSSEGAWRSGVAVPEGQNWNKGTLQGEWQPNAGWGWGGKAAPQAVPGYSTQKWGFTAGWIQRGGDYQIWIPNSRSAIPAGAVTSGPTPWIKP